MNQFSSVRLGLIAFTYDEATLLNVGGKGNQMDKKGSVGVGDVVCHLCAL